MERPERHYDEKPFFDTEIPGNIHSRAVRPPIERSKGNNLGRIAGGVLAVLLVAAISSGLLWIIAMIWRAIL